MDRTDLGRRAWRARTTATSTARRARATTARIALGIGTGVAIVVLALVGHSLLGRLGDPFALLVALPPMAHALASFGLRDILARRVAAVRTGERRLLAAYGLWLGTSALLTLDVAAVAAGSVAMAIGRDHGERRWQLGAAVVGSNVGSLLFPFSNLTNLVLVAGSGIGLGAWLVAAVPAQLAAAAAGGALLFVRFRADQDADHDDGPTIDEPPIRYVPARGTVSSGSDQAPIVAASLAAAVAVVAVVSGLVGGSIVWPFVAGSAVVTGWAVASGRLEPPTLRRRAPVGAFAVLVAAAVLAGPISSAAGILPRPVDASPVTLAFVALVGGGLAAVVNNLPAAAFGAAWLGVSSPVVVVAYLVGTNFGSVATPHGSVATILARSTARMRGRDAGIGPYLRNAWRYAAVTAVAAILALAFVAIR
jgi:Na+/H+ antiporter NhaD/arsenite permease-like protein